MRNAMEGLLRQRLQEKGKKKLWRWRKKYRRGCCLLTNWNCLKMATRIFMCNTIKGCIYSNLKEIQILLRKK